MAARMALLQGNGALDGRIRTMGAITFPVRGDDWVTGHCVIHPRLRRMAPSRMAYSVPYIFASFRLFIFRRFPSHAHPS